MNAKTLVVASSALTRVLISMTLEGDGLPTVEAISGPEALHLLRTRAAPVLMVLDLTTPATGALELLRQMQRSALLAFPVLAIADSADDPRAGEAMSLGATSFVTRPFTPEVLLAAARRVVPRQLWTRPS